MIFEGSKTFVKSFRGVLVFDFDEVVRLNDD